ncbi:hypothetical protein C8Q76DRAFT_59179 [Earliella scabrosa]|nr:hypothetical protein C8Q76DRAFT_59179 [Earliella scabrosa]
MTGRFRDMLDMHLKQAPSLTSSPVVVALPPLPPSPSSPPFDAVSIEGDLSEWEEAVLDELELDGLAQGDDHCGASDTDRHTDPVDTLEPAATRSSTDKSISPANVGTPAVNDSLATALSAEATASLSPLRCRLCLKDTCDVPVVTACGHLFCHRCIGKELTVSTECPVCRRAVLQKLVLG